LLLGDTKCTICKADLDEIVISSNKDLTWDEFDGKQKKKAYKDKEDETVYYDGVQAKA